MIEAVVVWNLKAGSNAEILLPTAFRRNGEGNVFTGVCPFTPMEGVPPPGQLGGGYPSQVRMGGTPSQVRMGSTPFPGQDGGTPFQGTPHPGLRSGQQGYPQLEQHGVYLLHGGRYASCVHAGGLSCFLKSIKPPSMNTISGESRISQTGDANPKDGSINLFFFQISAKNCMKIKDIGPGWGGGGASLALPLDPPLTIRSRYLSCDDSPPQK